MTLFPCVLLETEDLSPLLLETLETFPLRVLGERVLLIGEVVDLIGATILLELL